MRKICRESDGIAQEVWEMLRQDEIDGAQAMRLAAALNKMPESETGRQIRDNGLCAIRRFFRRRAGRDGVPLRFAGAVNWLLLWAAWPW